ncbi:hypothetical protein ACP70R_047385 [Stipagrostis hirtigluma subsp. patula]
MALLRVGLQYSFAILLCCIATWKKKRRRVDRSLLRTEEQFAWLVPP